MSENTERKSFWNWIGLPDAGDMRELGALLQAQSAQLTRMEAENRRLAAALERSQKRIGALKNILLIRQEQCAARTAREIMEHVQSCTSEIVRELESAQEKATNQRNLLAKQYEELASEQGEKISEQGKSLSEQCAKLLTVSGRTQETLRKSALNQDELLRVLIVNALQDECEAMLKGTESRGARKKR